MSGRYIWTDGKTDDGSPSRLGGQCFFGPPFLLAPTIRCRVRINESNQGLRHNPPTNRTEPITSRTNIGFAKNVIPERSLALPTNGSHANLLRGDRGDADVTSHGLARRQPDALPALQVTDGKRMIIFNFAFTRDGHRQLNEFSHQLFIDFLRTLCGGRTGCVEKQLPVDHALTRYRTKS